MLSSLLSTLQKEKKQLNPSSRKNRRRIIGIKRKNDSVNIKAKLKARQRNEGEKKDQSILSKGKRTKKGEGGGDEGRKTGQDETCDFE